MDRKINFIRGVLMLAVWLLLQLPEGLAQQKGSIVIDASAEKSKIASTLHGIFFEEISHAGEGGLYAELIQNRGFEESRLPYGTVWKDSFAMPKRSPHFMLPGHAVSDWKLEWRLKSKWPAWQLQTKGTAVASMQLTQQHPLNNATPNSLQLKITRADQQQPVQLINEGFWGINTIAGETYQLSFYLRNTVGAHQTVRAALQSDNGTELAAFVFSAIGNSEWKKYSCSLKAVRTDPKAKFVLSFENTGVCWIDFVSLFPAKTFHHRPNGLRPDLANLIEDLKPAFIRWPGGCFVEGISIENAHNWKNTIGPIEKRPGTYSPWGYWSSDGFGYHEYLQFCEDIHAAALYVFNAGVSCEYRSGTYAPEDSIGNYVQNALDAIEYAIGPVSSRWGRLRAANGHPQPFPLQYVEIGNEQHGPEYAKRYNVFYKAIKEKYPSVILLASMGIADVNQHTLDSMQKIDMVDEHAYKSVFWSRLNDDHFDKYPRGKWQMYAGEYATNNGVGTGNMNAALSDAVYIMAMERNGDLVKMSSYAPLLVNENDVDWPVNLIHFNAAQSFGRISYYLIKMMNANRADVNLSFQTTIQKNKNTQPQFSGSIGLATWDTKAEYRDISVEQNGKILYQCDMLKHAEDWDLLRGNWQWRDSGLAQIAEGAQQFAMLKGKHFDTYTLRLKARKLDGYNAFIIPFAVKDSNTFMRMHIGAWWNKTAVIEQVENGYEVTDLSTHARLSKPVETNKWYDIRMEVGMDTVTCFLNDELIVQYAAPEKIFALAGRDKQKGDIIVKLVNAGADSALLQLSVPGITVGPLAEIITLAASAATAENSFALPGQYVPVRSGINIPGNSFNYQFKPYSITVLRIKDKQFYVKRSKR